MASASTSEGVNPSKPLMLLSLDGGGIRGLSELCILEDIMHRVKRAKKMEEEPLPADYFDMIGGTSTGGLVALLLGRLRLSIPVAKVIFARMSEEIFSEQKSRFSDGRFKATNLENSIKKVLKELKCDENEKLLVASNNPCKTFVCAVAGEDIRTPRLFRTYDTKYSNYNPAIWEAGRATSAAPTFFKHIDIGDPVKERFVDGGLGYNNPCAHVVKEAMEEFASESNKQVACIVSIGTGMGKIIRFDAPTGYKKLIPKDLLKALAKIATETQTEADKMEERFRNCPGLYFRLNVDLGLDNVELGACENLGVVETTTKSYLQKFEVARSIDLIAEGLLGKTTKSYPLKHLGGLYQPPKSKVLASIPNFRAAHFVQRDDLLLKMQETFESPRSSVEPRVTVLIGMGGCGKSQLALEYCKKARNDHDYTIIFWIDATSPETSMQDFGKFAKLLAKPLFEATDLEENLQFIRTELENSTQKWLLVFDNYDDPACFKDRNFKEYFPQTGLGSIIITTRHRDARSLGLPLEASKMTPHEATDLLLRRSEVEQTVKNKTKAGAIVERLGSHALAIDQAGAYISKRGMQDISLYLKDFETLRDKVLNDAPMEWEYKRRLKQDPMHETNLTVFTTWEMSFDMLSGDSGSRQDKERLLTIMAFFDHNEISDTLFQIYAAFHPDWMLSCRNTEKWDAHAFRSILCEMHSLSLLQSFQVNSEEAIVSIHPLVQDWLKLRRGKESTRPFAGEAVLILGKSIDLINSGKIKTTFPQRQKLLTHLYAILPNCVNSNLETKTLPTANLLYVSHEFADFLGEEGWHKRAIIILEQVVEGYKKLLGEKSINTLNSISLLARNLQKQGKYPEAMLLYQDTLLKQQELLGKEHPETLNSMSNLALLLKYQGRYPAAELLYRDTLLKQRELLGKEHPDTLNTMNNLAALLQIQQKYPEGELLYRDALLKRQELLGKEHPNTLNTMNNLASILRAQGKLEESESLFRQTLSVRQRVLGNEHPDTLRTMKNLAFQLKHQSKLSEAEPMYREVLAARERILGNNHPGTLTSKHNLAGLLCDRGNLVEAESILRSSRLGFETTFGPKHPKLLSFLSHFAKCLDLAGKDEEAKTIREQIRTTKKEVEKERNRQLPASPEEVENDTRG